jgi:RNA polymerase sigma-70 factor (ECF subfamily)
MTEDLPQRIARPAEAAPQGDALDAALDQLYERYAGRVERWVRRLVGPGAEVEDLLHDVFVVALRKRREFRGDASLQTWLFRITQNVVASRRRRSRIRRWLLDRHTQDPSAAAPPPGSPLEQIERREQQVRLYAALDRLPDKYRTALVLYELEGLSGQELAALLGEDVSTIWVRLHRARAKLQAALGGEGEA